MVGFRVYGLPAAQGSKNPYGGEANKRLKPWRNDVAVAARQAMGQRVPTHEPISLNLTFSFPRPKSHYRTGRHAGQLKEDAPFFVPTNPDLDKLVRAVGDAITGIVVRDDRQVVALVARKLYDDVPGVEVRVSFPQ